MTSREYLHVQKRFLTSNKFMMAILEQNYTVVIIDTFCDFLSKFRKKIRLKTLLIPQCYYIS